MYKYDSFISKQALTYYCECISLTLQLNFLFHKISGIGEDAKMLGDTENTFGKILRANNDSLPLDLDDFASLLYLHAGNMARLADGFNHDLERPLSEYGRKALDLFSKLNDCKLESITNTERYFPFASKILAETMEHQN